MLGNQLDEERTYEAVQKAVENQEQELNLEEAGCYMEPAVYQDDKTLKKHQKQMNKLTDVVITYDFADRTETVDKDVIKKLASTG